MKKILFLALHLGYGGAEKAIIAEANMLAERYDVEIACVYKLYDKPAFPVDKKVKITYLAEDLRPNKDELKEAIRQKRLSLIVKEGFKSIKVLFYRTWKIKQLIKTTDADTIISTRYLYHKLLSKTCKKGVVTIAQEHNHHKNNQKYIKKMVDSVENIDYFMPVSKELTEFYSERVKAKCVYIPHSLEYIPDELSELNKCNIISVGRLSKEKGFEDLIRVFSLIHEKCPEWTLHIVGDGDERGVIERTIVEMNLNDSVVLHGYQNKEYINELLSKSSVYVMTSHEEAFGIVLIEAQSFGIPCVAYDSARGALEIIKNEENGFMIEGRDANKMANAVIRLINNPEERRKMGMKGRSNSLQYSTEFVKKMWFDFIDSI